MIVFDTSIVNFALPRIGAAFRDDSARQTGGAIEVALLGSLVGSRPRSVVSAWPRSPPSLPSVVHALSLSASLDAIGGAPSKFRPARGFLAAPEDKLRIENMSDAGAARERPGSQTLGPSQSKQHAEGLPLAAGLACLILIGINLRPAIVSVGSLLTSIRQAFGLSHTEASFLTTRPDVLMGVLALPTPWLARRYGRDRVILVALALLLLATLSRAFTDSVTALLASTVAVGAGIAIAGALVGGFIKAAYAQRAAFVSGIYAAALAAGSAVSATISSPISQIFGSWRFGLGAWAIPGLLAIGAWLFIESHQRREARGSVAVPRQHKLPIANSTAWLIALFFGCDNFLFYGLVSWLAPLYHEHGVDDATAGLILASFPAVFIVATPLADLFTPREDRRWILAAFSGAALLGTLALAIAPYALPFLFVPVASFGIAGGFALGMTLPLDNTKSPEEANTWNDFVITVAYLIAATRPLSVGALRDLTGDFRASLWLLAGSG